MKWTTRIGILCFLYTRDELSTLEMKELMSWKSKSAENEKLFFQLTDPESLQGLMQEDSRSRDRLFERLNKKFPWLSETDSLQPLDGRTSETENQKLENDLWMPFGKRTPKPGKSSFKYWASMISRLKNAKEIGYYPALIAVSGNYQQPIYARGRLVRRISRIAGGVVCLMVLLFVIDAVYFEDKYSNYKAGLIYRDGQSTIIIDGTRGMGDGTAGIKFGETEKGEPIRIVPNEPYAGLDKFYTVFTGLGRQYILQLPDGTRIWMNADTRVRYPANFSQRKIHLEVGGEAYIERSGDDSREFFVSMLIDSDLAPIEQSNFIPRRSIEIKPSAGVAMSNYVDKNEMLVTKIHQPPVSGVISGEPDLLKLNQQIVLYANDSLSAARTVDGNELIAWKNDEFNFKDADFSSILPALVKWYNADIHLARKMPTGKFNLRMPRSSPLPQVLDSLKSQGLKYTRFGNRVTIW